MGGGGSNETAIRFSATCCDRPPAQPHGRYRSNGEHLLNVVIEARPDYPNLLPTARAPERERGGSSMRPVMIDRQTVICFPQGRNQP